MEAAFFAFWEKLKIIVFIKQIPYNIKKRTALKEQRGIIMSDMNKKKKLPIGVDSFEKIIHGGYYYLDKTLFIRELLMSHGEVNLFTRPRRFGKTLNMSMLRAFFDAGTDRTLFDGLNIRKEKELCETYQGKYPVIFLSLKGIEGRNYAEAIRIFSEVISIECQRLSFLLDSPAVSGADKARFSLLLHTDADLIGLQYSLVTLMRMLHMHYNKQVVLLIDEYDVPLDKANDNGYYSEMVSFLRGFLGEAFKTNPDLYFAVVTGCLRISKESIFTGVNNLKANTISDVRFDEYFGFTDEDVQRLLSDYSLEYAYDGIKEWYDGYRFGNTEVYCPWDVVNHCDKLLAEPDAEPETYWDNSSSNQLVRHLVDHADGTDRDDIERLISGECLEKKLVMNLTYEELDKKELLWSVLYQTGYLTLDFNSRSRQRGYARFLIPNREIQELFIEKVREWFSERIESSREVLAELGDALQQGNTAAAEEFLNHQLRMTISYYDSYEGFDHGFLLGLLKSRPDWIVLSNRETGMGRSDIQIKCGDGLTGIVLEVKQTKARKNMDALCDEALRQICERHYEDALFDDGFTQVWIYGITFCKKSCRIHAEKLMNA